MTSLWRLWIESPDSPHTPETMELRATTETEAVARAWAARPAGRILGVARVRPRLLRRARAAA